MRKGVDLLFAHASLRWRAKARMRHYPKNDRFPNTNAIMLPYFRRIIMSLFYTKSLSFQSYFDAP